MSTVFKTERSTRIVLAISTWPLVLLGLGGAYNGAILEGFALATVFAVMWVWFATLTVEVSSEFVTARRIGQIVWRAERAKIRACFGRGGDLKTHAALILDSPDQRKRFDVLRTMFGADQLSQMAQMLGARGTVPGGIF